MEIVDNYKKVVFQNYANFDGRATRGEFWWFVLANFIIGVVLGVIDNTAGTTFGDGQGILGTIYSLAVLIPGIAVAVRRLHDVGKSGWWYLLVFTIIGILYLLYLFVQEGDKGSNEYGPNPLEGNEINQIGKE